MPALIANTVSLEEVLEVRGGPLNEQELWAVLTQSCEALHNIFIQGKARKRHFGTYTITPATILLCHTGNVKFSLDEDCTNDRSFTAPETYARRTLPSETALEKICVYSLGMSIYHAAEFEVPVGKPIILDESLENVLLTMCEDSAQARRNISQVLQACHSTQFKHRHDVDVVASLVESLLGDDIPDIELNESGLSDKVFENDDYHQIDREISPVLASPRHLPSPPPPQISTRGQVTAVQLVGSNHRLSYSLADDRSASPRSMSSTLEKYKGILEDSRNKRSMAKSLNGLDQLDSRPKSKSQTADNGRHSPTYQEVQSSIRLSGDLESRLQVNGSRKSTDYGLRRYSSANSVTSHSSSTASGPRSSMFSDGRSSSAVSLTHGSYAPESYFTDGYESEFYLTSHGSSVSRNRVRDGRQPQPLRDQRYLSVNDVGHPPLPKDHLPPDVKQFTSLPDISKGTKTASANNSNKVFFGPEFVMITEDPEKSIVNITPNAYLKKDAQKKAGTQNRRMVTVVALNGQKLQLMAEVSMTTKDLYDHVIKFLGITEKSFFGLAKIEEDEVIFLELDVKLSKYAPPKWKEPKGEIVEFILYFRVKFYVEHIALLSHLSSRHQFYLQLRKDILEGRLYCHEEAAFILAGLALQAETGDLDDSLDQEYFLVEHYLHPRIINKVSTEYAISQLPEFHQNFTGLSEDQAELDFVQEAQKLPEYGIHFYKVQASKKADAEKLYLGICVRGLTVYESMGHIKTPIHKHSWPLTKKISFKKKKFFIEPRANPDGARLTFYTNHYKKAKYLLSMCKAFHRFQMQMRTRLASIEHEVALDFASEKQQQKKSPDSTPRPSPYERTPLPPSYKQTSVDISRSYKQMSIDSPRNELVRSVSQDLKHSTDGRQQERYREYSIDVNHNIGNHGENMHEKNKASNGIQRISSVDDGLKDSHDDIPYVIDSTLNYQRSKSAKQQDAINPIQIQELEVPNRRDILRSPDREIRVIKLRKEPSKGLGITVLGGENSKRLDLGIYVKSITDGGAAANDGRLKAGDCILAVNGNSLEHVTHEKAVSLLKTTSSTVELVVSQSPHNVSAFDLSNIPNTAASNEEPQTLEVKPLLTPPQHDSRRGTWSSSDTPSEAAPSTLNFPSQDEPVTMISKSISSLASQPPTQVSTAVSKPSTVSVEVTSPPELQVQPSKVSMVESRLSSLDSHQSDLSSDSYTAGSERSTDHELSENTFTVELEKVNGSLGLSVTGGINTTVKHGAIYVKSLILNGPADRNGHVRVGDRILRVNGISLKSVTHKQAVEIIKKAPEHCTLLIDRSLHVNVPTSIKKTSSRNQVPDQPFVVELTKGIGGLGLSLVGGRDAGPQHGGLLRIKKMFPGQPAAQSDKLLVGDIVLEVNGKSIENATHQEAINMIRLEPSTVRLLVKRDPSSIPKELLNRTASDASDIDPAQLLNDIQSKLRTDVKSPTQTRPTLQLCNQPSLSDSSVDQLTNEKNDRTDVWVKQESPRIRQRDLGSLTYQFSDPLTSRHIEHEPVTSSNSLPGKFQLKSPYADKRTKRVDSSKEVDDVETRDSSKISSESDLSSLLTQIKSEDSLQRTFSPQAPLAEYEESDLDEGIMVNVDEGIMINVDDGTVINITDDDGDSNSDDSLEDDTRHSGTPLPSGFNGDDRQTGQQSSNMNAMHKYDDRDGITLAKTDKAYSDSDVITSAKTDKFYNDGDVITSVRTEKAYDGSDVFTPVTGDKAYDGSHVITPVTGDKAYDGSHVITSVTADEVDDGNDSTTSAATSKSGDDDDDNASIATSKDDDDEDLTPRKTHKDVDTMGSLDTYRTDNNDNITSTATYNDIEDNHNILMKTDKNEEKTSLDKYKGSDNTYNINITSDITSQVDNDSKNDSDDDSMSDEIDSAEDDIDSVLELLDNIHKGETKTTNTGNQQYAACNAPRSQDIVKQGHAYQTESEPELFNFKKLEDKLENIKPKEPDAFHASKLKSHSESSLPDVLNSKDDDDTSSDSDAEQPINDESTFNLTEQHDSDMSRLTPQEQLITVELEKRDSGGLGFTLAGGADTMGGCFVRDIIGDPAKADGRLQKGDQILQVDDIDIRDMKHMAAVNVLRATKKNVKLIVLRRPAGMVSDGSSLETVNLTRTSRGRIGLLLTEGQDGVILVDDVVPGEPAAVQGNLKHGDRIVEIGGCKVDGIGFLAARQQLDASRPVVQLLVERRNQAAYSKYSMGGPSLQESISLDLSDNLSQSDGERSGNESPVLEQTDEVLEISLDKGPRGFGFSLEAAPSSEPNVQGIFIKTISSGSVAEEDGRLRVGDQLLTVNNEDVRGLSHARVIGMLRKVTSTVTLQISRPSIRNAQPSASQSPPSNSLDLDITLEDKDTSTGSSEIKDEKELVDVLQSISSTNPETTPTVATTKPKLNKRTTDTVLSSLLRAIGSPPDNEIHDDSSEPLNNGNNEEQWLSSSSLEDKQLSDSSAVDLEVSSDDSDYDDVDVFDMLHDNSDARGTHVTDRTLDSYVDFPPPLPTTPIPSDDDDDEVPPLPPRRESSNQHINGYGSLHSSSEEEMTIKHDVPLVSVVPNGRYTGHKLKMLIGALQTKLASNTPADEFKALREIKPTDGCDVAKHPDNKDKNRYRNVLPFNSTRVCLGGEGNDSYINASHIRVPVGQETYHYIATQGPLPNTIKDFWKMVWEQGVEVIAMLTMEMEGGKVKCSKYWPDSLDVPLNIPSFQIALLNKKTSSSYTERTLSLKHLESGVSVEVTHLNFSSWPDHGVPKSSVEMVQFVTYMRSLASSEVPVLVHCSAGIGRTGAMITVDSSLGLIQKDLMFDVDKIIRILREQRQGMIQTKDQYIFCYKACLEVLRSLKD